MILSDGSIRELVDKMDLIFPYSEKQLQPASYDVILDDINLSPTMKGDETFKTEWLIHSKQFVLGTTLEKICLPDNVVARIEGKSSWARKGLIVHTAGFIDPGWHGTLTLEITNLSDKDLFLRRGDLIAQIAFQHVDKSVERPYGTESLGSHYQNQQGITKSYMDK